MPHPAQLDADDLSLVSFPIRFNDGHPNNNNNSENSNLQTQDFLSLADLRSNLPASCDLVQYVRNPPQPFSYQYIPHPPPQPAPSFNPVSPLYRPSALVQSQPSVHVSSQLRAQSQMSTTGETLQIPNPTTLSLPATSHPSPRVHGPLPQGTHS